MREEFMGLTRRAKRGIAAFHKIQTSNSRVRYMMRRMTIESGIAPNIVNAALAAAEAINASVQILSKSENNPVAPNEEGGSEQRVPVQPETGKTAAEGTSLHEGDAQ